MLYRIYSNNCYKNKKVPWVVTGNLFYFYNDVNSFSKSSIAISK